MKVIVFGASGGVGRHVVEQALAAGHEVTAFVRTPSKLSVAGARVVQGDALDPTAVAAAVTGHDAVISALGPTRGAGSHTSVRRMAADIGDAMQAAEVDHIVWCGSEGIDGEMTGPAGWLVMTLLARPFADHRAAVAALRARGRTVTVARPRSLKDAPLRTDYVESRDVPARASYSIPARRWPTSW